MMRIAAALAALCVLLALTFSLLDVRSDAAAIFGPGGPELDSLDTAQGREVIVALVSHDIDARTRAARALASLDDPLIETVRAGPSAPSEAFLDWLWQNRLRLSPPHADDLAVEAMAATLGEARDALASGEGMLLADRLLRDPTGAFTRILKSLPQIAGNGRDGGSSSDSGCQTGENNRAECSAVPTVRNGVFQSADNSAALVFITLDDRPLVTKATAALAARIREIAVAHGVEPLLIGPRIVSAEISAETERASMRAALVAGALLLLWLLWALRARLLLALLPLALGIAAATLTVQLLFGSVHVAALGFGGALTGLALDYPLHLLGHGGKARPHASRLVLIGAITTAVGFLAMLGSGVPALMQTGVFIAAGLAVAALVSRVLLAQIDVPVRTPALESLALPVSRASWIAGTMIAAAALVLALGPQATPGSLFEPPARVTDTVERMSEMIALPSGRHAIEVEAPDLDTLLSREASLRPVLDAAVRQGALGGYRMLADFLPPPATLPTVGDFEERAREALTVAGMTPAYAATQVAAYRAALEAQPVTLSTLKTFPETRFLAATVEETETGLRERIGLIGPDPGALNIIIDGARLIDMAEPIESGVLALRRQVILWLALGAVASFLILLAALGSLRATGRIALTTAAAVAATAAVLTLATGPLSVFQIVALTLVTGIGIDYGLFLGTARNEAARIDAYRSIALCAGSTLIAFAVMAFAPVSILSEIGLAVSLGVLAMLGLSLIQPPADT